MIKLKVTYNKIIQEIVEINADLLKYLECEPIYSIEELEEIIKQFIEYDSEEINEYISNNYEGDCNYVGINIEELIQQYKYLIEKYNCCEYEEGNYCSTCGIKLK